MDTTSLETAGWFISENSLAEIKEYLDKPTKQSLMNYLLNNDIKDYGSGWLTEAKNKSSNKLTASGVVQLSKVRNVAAPLSDEMNQTAPPLLKLSLTDGKASISALCFPTCGEISMNTPPGTKIKLHANQINIQLGFLLLETRNCLEILGGKVASLISNWELKQKLSKYKNINTRFNFKEGGPPPFVSFGTKIGNSNPKKGFRSMDTVKDLSNAQNNSDATGEEEDVDFTDKRRAEISQARQRGEGVKQFVANTESKFAQRQMDKANEVQMLDRHIAELMSMGFSSRDANGALKMANNDFQQALDFLVSGKFHQQMSLKNGDDRGARRGGGRGGGRGRRRGGGGGYMDDDDDDGPVIDTGPVAKPSGTSTLGDFFTAQVAACEVESQKRVGSAIQIVRPGYECKAQWMDRQYYRVRVNSVQQDGMINVTYLDFDETQPVPLHLLRTNDNSKISPQQVCQPTENRYYHNRHDNFQQHQQYERRGRGRGGYGGGRGGSRGGHYDNNYRNSPDYYQPEERSAGVDSRPYRVNSAPNRSNYRGHRGRGGY